MRAYHNRDEVIADHLALQEEVKEELEQLTKSSKKETIKKGITVIVLLILIVFLLSLLTGKLRISSSTFEQGYVVRLNEQAIDYQLYEVRDVVLMPFRWHVKKVFQNTIHQITNQPNRTFQLGEPVSFSIHFYTCELDGQLVECQNKLLEEPKEQAMHEDALMTIQYGKKNLYQGPLQEELLPYLTKSGSYQIIIDQKLKTGTSQVTVRLEIN